MQINPYLSFNGNCEEVLAFYQNVFNGEVTALNRYEGAPMPVPDHYKNKVLHASLEFEGNTLMMCDAMPGSETRAGNNFSISLSMNEVMTMNKIFDHLSTEGTITMPLQDTFWGARFGMIRDKFGINWMVNCDLN